MITSQDVQRKTDDILKRFVYTEFADREEAKRIKNLKQDFDRACLVSQVAGSEPVKMFIAEIERAIGDINFVLVEKKVLELDERSALLKLKEQFQSWKDFWTLAGKRAESIASHIEEEHKIKTAP